MSDELDNFLRAMTQKERDYYLGQLADLNAERKEFAKEIGLDEKIDAIDRIVTGKLQAYLQSGILDQCEVIVTNVDNKEAAEWVARKYKLGLIVSFFVPAREVFVTTKAKADMLIQSRSAKHPAMTSLKEFLNP
jgi:hypothetical protein